MNIKGQGALEYLLLIGGAVLVAAIVIALITGIPTPTQERMIRCGTYTGYADCVNSGTLVDTAGDDFTCKSVDTAGANVTSANPEDFFKCIAVTV